MQDSRLCAFGKVTLSPHWNILARSGYLAPGSGTLLGSRDRLPEVYDDEPVLHSDSITAEDHSWKPYTPPQLWTLASTETH